MSRLQENFDFLGLKDCGFTFKYDSAVFQGLLGLAEKYLKKLHLTSTLHISERRNG